MSSAGAQCNHLNHVSTQLPYAMTCAAISALTYIVAGLTKNLFLSLLIGLVILIAVMYVMSVRSAKEAAKEMTKKNS
jgi:Na+/H+ antiporter NhaC